MAEQRQNRGRENRETREEGRTVPEEATGHDGEEAGQAGRSEGGSVRRTVRNELTGVVREAAIEVLTPVARKATTSAAKYAVTRAPELLKDVIAPRLEGAGGPLAVAKGVASTAGGVASKAGAARERLPKLGRGGDGGGAQVTGTGRGRRLPVQEYIDVAVPAETAYDQWTQFEEFPKFMRGVEQIEQRDDTTLVWHEKLWGVRRSWVAEITDQRPGERIAWHSTSGPKHAGVVTFHELAPRLTRVQVSLDHQPTGVFERTASGMRYTRRALKSDLKRFKAFIEMSEEPTGSWRGRVEEGEVADKSGEEASDHDDLEAQDRDLDDEEEEFDDEEQPKRTRASRRSSEDAEPDGEEPEEAEEEPERRTTSAQRRRRPRAGDEDDDADEAPRPRRRAAARQRR